MTALAADGGSGPRRSLVLAGGGMRVAYQAGVLRALEQEGLTFFHADGTSGGTINLAMLLSGLAPEEMCERWRTLRVRDFVSFLPLRKYARSLAWPAFGGADGLVRKVYPHLGVDVARIRAARGIAGTFNVCDFGSKTNRAVPHEEIDLDLLVAGVSLPMAMPPVRRGDSLLVDSVWIKDANVTEAVRRGAEEIWLVWCIGNSGVYRSGAFNQYVHTIELSANGGLFEELAHLRAELGDGALPRLHVIRPAYPLPLDPDFLSGRIDASALVAAGYRDACAYLAAHGRDGVPWTPGATRMRDQRRGAAFVQRLHGSLAGDAVDVDLRVDVRDLAAFARGPRREAEAVGVVDSARAGRGLLTRSASVQLERGRLRYELELSDGSRLELAAPARPWRSWASAEWSGRDPGRLRSRFVLRGLQATGSDSLRARVRAVARLAWLLVKRDSAGEAARGVSGTRV